MVKVYFIHAVRCNRIKIGASADVSRRMYELSTSCPDDLVYLGSVPAKGKQEQKLHKMFYKYRVHGEWFEADQSIIAWIEAHRSKDTIEINYRNAKRQSIRATFAAEKQAHYERLTTTFLDKYELLRAAYDRLNQINWTRLATDEEQTAILALEKEVDDLKTRLGYKCGIRLAYNFLKRKLAA